MTPFVKKLQFYTFLTIWLKSRFCLCCGK